MSAQSQSLHLHDITAYKTTFRSNNFFIGLWCHCGRILAQSSPMTNKIFWFWETLAQSSLQHCFSSLRFADIYLCIALLRLHCSISVCLRSGPLQRLDFFFFVSHSVLDLLLCLESIACCMAQFQPSFSFKLVSHLTLKYYSMFCSMTARCVCSCIASLIHHPSCSK